MLSSIYKASHNGSRPVRLLVAVEQESFWAGNCGFCQWSGLSSGLPPACLSTLLGAVDMLDQHRAPLIWGVERLRESWTGFFLALCFQEHSSSLGGNGCVPHSLYLVSSGFTVCPVDSQPCWPAWEGSQCG